MVKYIKCPRCELNYIDPEKQDYCDVCIAEMKGNKLEFADLDDEELDEELENETSELCPICGVNHIRFGETMCEECRQKSEYEDDVDVDPDKDEEWKNYLDDETDDLTLDDAELDEELKEELEEDDFGEEEENDDDFFEEVDPLDDIDDYDEDDEDDDDDDDDLF